MIDHRILINKIAQLEKLATAEARRTLSVRPYIFQTIAKNVSSLFTKENAPHPSTHEQPRKTSAVSFVPAVPWTQRVFAAVLSSEVRYAFKVAAALSCLLAMLWAPTSRTFFLNFTVRNATVPLLLALMPTLGLSILSWIGQLGGAILGILWACLSLVIWRGVGKQAYCVPSLFFFEWFLCLAVGHRMLYGPDFLAVTSMNACAIVSRTRTLLLLNASVYQCSSVFFF